MYIDVVFSPSELASRANISNKTAVIIDVLRATSTIAYAFWGYRKNNIEKQPGCSKIIPVAAIEEARNIAASADKNITLIAGERECLKPEGFDLGNSPDEYVPEKVKDKTIIFTTTNGTKALKLSEGAKFITTASFANASACAGKVCDTGNDVLIICAGRANKTTMEDSACAGLIAGLLVKRCDEKGQEFKLSDSADIAIKYFHHYKNDIHGLLSNSEAGKNLINVGLEKDIADCSLIDILSIVIEYKDGYLTGYSL